MSLASGVSDLATRIATYLKGSVVPRLLPSGGTANQVLIKTSAADFAAGWISQVQDVGFFCAGPQLTANETLGIYVATRPFLLPNGFAGSQAIARVAATGSVTLVITQVTGTGASAVSTQIGTVTFAAGAYVGTFTSTNGQVSIATGDRIFLTGSSSVDATLADFGVILAGLR